MQPNHHKQPVFIVGQQRSGSNLLRLMLHQHTNIAAPHPPHILSRFFPLLPYYGNLNEESRFSLLLSDIIHLIKRNPIPWTGVPLQLEAVRSHCEGQSLIAAFGAVMDTCAEAQQATMWVCKSMDTIRWREELDASLHQRLPRYLYLYRDGRDVCLSFLKAVIGEKHPYCIAREWAERQALCLREGERLGKERFLPVRYERLITAPEETLRQICAFLDLPWQPAMLHFFQSTEARQCAQASSLWKHLNQPVHADNTGKFARELSVDDIRLFESVAGDLLERLGYERTYPSVRVSFTPAQIEDFSRRNEEAKALRQSQMNPKDKQQRDYQLSLLQEIKERLTSKNTLLSAS